MKLKKRIVVLLLMIAIAFNSNIVSARIYFYDVFGHWAEDYIMWGTNIVGLLNGYEDGTFRPNDNMSRSEYLSLIYRTAVKQGLISDEIYQIDDEENVLNYIDLDPTFWAYDHIYQVKSYIDEQNYHIKFEDIFPGNSFLPNAKITREEAAILGYFFTTPSINSEDIFLTDIDSEYRYYDELKKMVNNGIITGNDDKTFKPMNNITRAEVVTIIKRLYEDMEYRKKSYIDDITILEDEENNNYPLFGAYNNKQLSKEDLLYKRAIETLEYKALVEIIPFEEQHLYDLNPVKTLEKLKEDNYENIIGVNYYLIKNNSDIYNDKVELVEEIFNAYIDGAILNDEEVLIIFKDFSHLVEDKDLLLSALNLWETTTNSEINKYNALFLKSRIYLSQGEIKEALELYNGVEIKDIKDMDIYATYILNLSYILVTINEYDLAESILREGWEQIKALDSYNIYRVKYDEQFTGALKQVLMIKQK